MDIFVKVFNWLFLGNYNRFLKKLSISKKERKVAYLNSLIIISSGVNENVRKFADLNCLAIFKNMIIK